MTIREGLRQNIEAKKKGLAMALQALATLKGSYLLDVELAHANVSVLSMKGKTWLWIRSWGNPREARILLGKVMDALGVTQASKSKDDCAVIEIDGLCVDFDLPALHCRKARVTKTEVIEFCGPLDESKYSSIEYLDEKGRTA